MAAGSGEADKPAATVLNVSGIPCPTQVNTMSWVRGWVCALALFLPIQMWISASVYYSKTVRLPEIHPLNVSVATQGCDVIFERSQDYSWARLGYWKAHGSGALALSPDGESLSVNAIMKKKDLISNCIVRIALTDKAMFDHVSVKVEPDEFATTNPKPSNIAESVAVKFTGVHAQTVHLSILAAAESIVQGVSAESVDITVSGGKLSIMESPGSPATADRMTLDAHDATVEVNLHKQDVAVTLDENATITTSMAAASISPTAGGYYLGVSNGTTAKYTDLSITSSASAIYMMIADSAYMTRKDLDLVVEPSAAMKEGNVTFLESGKAVLNNLQTWLKQNADQKFMVYICLTAANAPRGTMRLMSTAVYTAFSVTLFSFFSTSMLEPNIERIEVPVVGFPAGFLWPRRDFEKNLTKKQELEYAENVFLALTSIVDISNLTLDNARWIWDPPGPDYVFVDVPGKHGEPSKWFIRPIEMKDNIQIYLATIIVLAIGLILGAVVCRILFFTVRPAIMRKIRKMNTDCAASFRLSFSHNSSTFNLNTCFVHWPLPGVLIRWQNRPLGDEFTSLTFAARSWPESDFTVAKEGIDPGRIPTHPDCPGQQFFFFASQPSAKPQLPELSVLLNAFDNELHGMAQLRAGDKPLKIGVPMQFRISAYGGDKVIEKSGWSRPTMIRAAQAFTEYPLLLWKSTMRLLPDDTFQYFLDRHTMPLDNVPMQVMTLSRLTIYAENTSDLFAGKAIESYGEDDDEQTICDYLTCSKGENQLEDIVSINISTGGDIQEHDDQLFVTASAVLPPGSGRQPKTFQQIFKRDPSPNESDVAAFQYIVIAFDNQEMPLKIGPRKDQVVQIEATVADRKGVNRPYRSRYQTTWADLCSVVTSGEGKLGSSVVMRDGLKPVCMLMADVKFSNTRCKDPAAQNYDDRFPKIFRDVYQGAVFQWGMIITCSWDWEQNNLVKEDFQIVIVSEGLKGKAVPDSLWKAKKKVTVVCSKVSGPSGKASVSMVPDQPWYVQTMRCQLEVRLPSAKGQVYATSAEFVITRPVTMENLELGYSAFCIANDIPMNPLSRTKLLVAGVQCAEREVYAIPGYREPLPMPYELKTYGADKGMDTIVMKENSVMLAGSDPLAVKVKKKATDLPSAPAPLSPTSASSPAGGLSTPLLRTEGSVSSVADTVETLTPQRVFIDLPVNVFWNYQQTWEEMFLLWYGCMPSFAMDGYMGKALREYDYQRLARVADRCDDAIRTILKIFLFMIQILFLWLPAMAVYFIVDYHDQKFSKLVPYMHPMNHADLIYLTDFTLNPLPFSQRFGLLDADDKWAYIFCVGYLLVIIVTTFYCTFLHSDKGSKGGIFNYIFMFFNGIITYLSFMAFFGLVLFACTVLIWMVIGAVIDPSLIPMAIGIIGVVGLVRINWSNLMTMKDHVESIIFSHCDLILHAIMSVFVGPPDSDVWLSMQSQATMTDDIVVWLLDLEQDITKPLLDQAKIRQSVSGTLKQNVALRRKSIQFLEGTGGVAKDKCLCTDFVPKDLFPAAQKIANDTATINNKRLDYDYKADYQPDEDVDITSFNKAMAKKAESMVPQPGAITQTQKEELDTLSKSMKLRPETTRVIFKAFTMATHLCESPEDVILKDPYAMGTLMSGIRKNTLFTHFVVPKDGDDPKSTMNKYMRELQNADMTQYKVFVAKAMTAMLDWQQIGRDLLKFVEKDIVHTYVRRTVNSELNCQDEKSLGFQTTIQLFRTVYDSFDTTYSKDMMKLFLDLGLVDERMMARPKCQAKMRSILDYYGAADPETLIGAIQGAFLPDATAVAMTESSGDIVEPKYLWYNALKSILKRLGWDDEEMEETWLSYKWHELTQGSFFFPYEDSDDLIQLIKTLSDEGLWKAATRAVMLKCQLFGYAHCDMAQLGKKKAAETAHKLYGSPDLQLDLQYLGSVAWPEYISSIWERTAAFAKVIDNAVKAPRFLPVLMVDDFLMDCVYMPPKLDAKGDPLEQVPIVSLNPTDAADQDKCSDDDGYLWHKLASGQRRLRGIWLELALKVFDFLDSVPSDLDVFYDNLRYQHEQSVDKREPVLQINDGAKWLKEIYLPTMVNTASFDQFVGLLKMVRCDIPAEILKDQVFSKCPLVPDDDLGELRYLTDLGGGLRIWIGFGMWKGAVEALIDQIMPPSPMRRMAHQSLSEEFDKLDKDGTGVIQPAQVLVLMQTLAHPGLSCDDISKTVKDHLGIEIPERQCHHYFTLMDVNCDGVMQANEFIPMMRLIMIDYFPGYVMSAMGVSWKFIFGFVLVLIAVIVGVLLVVQLVVATFTNGTSLATSLHSGFNSMVMAGGKLQGDSASGMNDQVSKVKEYLSNLCMTMLCAVMGLEKPIVDKITSILKGGI